MPTYVYRAMTRTGLIVKNRIESPSKQNLLKLLKSNGLIPIDVEQIRYIGKQPQKLEIIVGTARTIVIEVKVFITVLRLLEIIEA